ncbi:3'(2'),5'-bisphosphate nucleotidase CysQ [Galbibacter mesophilus]|uniref:3'(2'),5'-bisphosphate nucleotidase CysQ n=1 Tax=Galbibacter mesophilus TaxID=379069 RepID=UPI00191E7D7A|nr:3'(2'),5'-bisphosphate nucleotidase CysQ [Galbibacter mesophilus]MCM5663501.1 3'(2'),5'-bisphosphate nucleotidase CysQ [Galbibacter mesophilus]
MIAFKELLDTAVKASLEAGAEILKIYERDDFEVSSKQDNSPITLADKDANRIIVSHLQETGIPIISEESKTLDYEERKKWKRCWIVDPLDGTKEFIKRNGEFTVNIALVEDGAPVLGVIYVPVTNMLYFSDVEKKKAFRIQLEHFSEDYKKLSEELPQKRELTSEVKIVGSRSHFSSETKKYIEKLNDDGKNITFVSVGSSLKFCLLAEGKANVYPRFSPTMEWDTAAGHAICKAVGFEVLHSKTEKPLTYNKKELVNPSFVVH